MKNLNLNLFFAGLATFGLAGLLCIVAGILSENPLITSGLMSTKGVSVGFSVFFLSSVIGFVATSPRFILLTDKQKRKMKMKEGIELYIALCVGWGDFPDAKASAKRAGRELKLRELLKLRKDCLNLKHHKDVAAIDVLIGEIGELHWWER